MKLEDLTVCDMCGSVVVDQQIHTDWHAANNPAAIRNAYADRIEYGSAVDEVIEKLADSDDLARALVPRLQDERASA